MHGSDVTLPRITDVSGISCVRMAWKLNDLQLLEGWAAQFPRARKNMLWKEPNALIISLC
jgi:hypothetical protein